MKVFFIRHGETTGDIEDRFGGDYDDHLSEKGKVQSAAVAERLKGEGIEAIYASSLSRARETASYIAAATGAAVSVDPAIRERNQYGILTGMVKADAKKAHPDLVEALKDRLNTIEGAESYEAFSARVAAAYERIFSDAGHKAVAVVTHGGPLRVLFRDFLTWGELEKIGDCCFVELEKADGTVSYKASDGLSFGFPV